jgi:hypothetical protein
MGVFLNTLTTNFPQLPIIIGVAVDKLVSVSYIIGDIGFIKINNKSMAKITDISSHFLGSNHWATHSIGEFKGFR